MSAQEIESMRTELIETVLDKANAAAQSDDYTVATALFRQVATLDPRWADALEPLAQCLLETDDVHGAAEAAAAAVRTEPTWAAARLTLARAQLNAGAFGATAKSFGEAVALDAELFEEVYQALHSASNQHLLESSACWPWATCVSNVQVAADLETASRVRLQVGSCSSMG